MTHLIPDIDIVDSTQKEKDATCEVKITANSGLPGRQLYIESYGCQMNFSDSEIVTSILQKDGFNTTNDIEQADLILLNTCSIREKAELTVRKRLAAFNQIKKNKPEMTIGVLGCMAERLKSQLLEEEKIVDLVVGPDAYRDLPNLVKISEAGQKGVNTFLSREETYADISPVRLNSNGVILSRSFKGNFNEKTKDLFKKELSQSVKDFRNYEKITKNLNRKQLLDSYKLMKMDIEETLKNAKI